MHGLTFEPATHTYALDGARVPSVTGIIGAIVVSGQPIMDKRFFTADARDRGIYVHECVETINSHGSIDWEGVDERFRPYVLAYEAWKTTSGFEPVAVECRMASRSHWFAGTMDALGLIGGKTTLIDVKSGSPAPYHAIQLGGYAVLLEEHGYGIDQAFTVQVKRDGTFVVHGRLDGYAMSAAKYDFLALRRVHHLAGDPEPIPEFDPNEKKEDDDLRF
jgi:hypothetical protein